MILNNIDHLSKFSWVFALKKNKRTIEVTIQWSSVWLFDSDSSREFVESVIVKLYFK